ncbi:RNA polymerase sigma-70 factor [Chitinophaga sancti]|uniref:RNA polymerase sigma factor n=1 Tax=Chitinophaga sancti TaxID=1004 RepID=UPI002A74E66B|nr:RNA polymerase sigma-70 factor [Chitinophaga sancti]WPQ65269.1 RNA polymerase sigma-70 factor [Chitinophaga sancti]
MHHPDDIALVNKLAGNDEVAFEALFHKYKDKLYSFLLHLGNSPTAAEDVLQDVFMKLWTRRAQLGEIDNFNAYLFRMAANQAINLMRRQSREIRILDELQLYTIDENGTTQAMSEKEVQEVLAKALATLPQQQYKVFMLSREHGLKYEEIAAEMGISAATVRNHMVQALKKIRTYLESSHIISIIYLYIILAEKMK